MAMNLQYTDTMTSEEYNELRMCVGWCPITEGKAERGLEHTTFLMAARDRGKIVAMGRMLFDFGYTAYLGDVIVRPEYQGQMQTSVPSFPTACRCPYPQSQGRTVNGSW
ncbi:MAG: GNAT family N-acetyltransferase [Lachnospiraceae bacterium]|nr:GNAT family N-acetyltransferase [Lachnospiraceae bacterium]